MAQLGRPAWAPHETPQGSLVFGRDVFIDMIIDDQMEKKKQKNHGAAIDQGDTVMVDELLLFTATKQNDNVWVWVRLKLEFWG